MARGRNTQKKNIAVRLQTVKQTAKLYQQQETAAAAVSAVPAADWANDALGQEFLRRRSQHGIRQQQREAERANGGLTAAQHQREAERAKAATAVRQARASVESMESMGLDRMDYIAVSRGHDRSRSPRGSCAEGMHNAGGDRDDTDSDGSDDQDDQGDQVKKPAAARDGTDSDEDSDDGDEKKKKMNAKDTDFEEDAEVPNRSSSGSLGDKDRPVASDSDEEDAKDEKKADTDSDDDESKEDKKAARDDTDSDEDAKKPEVQDTDSSESDVEYHAEDLERIADPHDAARGSDSEESDQAPPDSGSLEAADIPKDDSVDENGVKFLTEADIKDDGIPDLSLEDKVKLYRLGFGPPLTPVEKQQMHREKLAREAAAAAATGGGANAVALSAADQKVASKGKRALSFDDTPDFEPEKPTGKAAKTVLKKDQAQIEAEQQAREAEEAWREEHDRLEREMMEEEERRKREEQNYSKGFAYRERNQVTKGMQKWGPGGKARVPASGQDDVAPPEAPVPLAFAARASWTASQLARTHGGVRPNTNVALSNNPYAKQVNVKRPPGGPVATPATWGSVDRNAYNTQEGNPQRDALGRPVHAKTGYYGTAQGPRSMSATPRQRVSGSRGSVAGQVDAHGHPIAPAGSSLNQNKDVAGGKLSKRGSRGKRNSTRNKNSDGAAVTHGPMLDEKGRKISHAGETKGDELSQSAGKATQGVLNYSRTSQTMQDHSEHHQKMTGVHKVRTSGVHAKHSHHHGEFNLRQFTESAHDFTPEKHVDDAVHASGSTHRSSRIQKHAHDKAIDFFNKDQAAIAEQKVKNGDTSVLGGDSPKSRVSAANKKKRSTAAHRKLLKKASRDADGNPLLDAEGNPLKLVKQIDAHGNESMIPMKLQSKRQHTSNEIALAMIHYQTINAMMNATADERAMYEEFMADSQAMLKTAKKGERMAQEDLIRSRLDRMKERGRGTLTRHGKQGLGPRHSAGAGKRVSDHKRVSNKVGPPEVVKHLNAGAPAVLGDGNLPTEVDVSKTYGRSDVHSYEHQHVEGTGVLAKMLGQKKSSGFAASVTVHDPSRHADLALHPGHHRSSVKAEDMGKDGKKGKTGAKALFDMKEAAAKSELRQSTGAGGADSLRLKRKLERDPRESDEEHHHDDDGKLVKITFNNATHMLTREATDLGLKPQDSVNTNNVNANVEKVGKDGKVLKKKLSRRKSGEKKKSVKKDNELKERGEQGGDGVLSDFLTNDRTPVNVKRLPSEIAHMGNRASQIITLKPKPVYLDNPSKPLPSAAPEMPTAADEAAVFS